MNKDKIIRNAQKYVSQGKIENAIREYEKILKTNPDDLNTLNTVGDLYIQLGDKLRATDYFKKVAKKYAEDGFYSKAIAVYKKISRINPNDVEVLENLADLFSKNGLLADAKKTYADIGKIYLKQNSFAKAYRVYKKVAGLSGDDPNIHLKLAELSLKLNQVENALESYLNAAKILLNNGEVEKAFNAAKIALEIDPTNIVLLKLLFKISIQRRDFEYITPILEKAYSEDPDNIEIKELLGHNYLFLGELEKAEKLFDEIFEVNSDKINIFLDFARAAITLEEYDLAAKNLKKIVSKAIEQKKVQQLVEFFETILENDPDNVEAYLGLASLYKKREDFGNYIKTMEKFVNVALKTGRYKEGLAAVEELLSNDFSNEEYLKLHREFFTRLFPNEPYVPPGVEEGESTKSFEFPTQELGTATLKKVKTTEDVLLEIDLLKEYGLIEKAKNKLKDKIEKEPENIKLIEKLASLYDEEGNKEDAAKLFLDIAKIYEKNGELERAREYRERAMEMSPSLEEKLVTQDAIFGDEEIGVEEIELEELEEVEKGEEYDISKLADIGSAANLEEIFEEERSGSTEEISLEDLNIDNFKEVSREEEPIIELERLGQTGEINIEEIPSDVEDKIKIEGEKIFEPFEEEKKEGALKEDVPTIDKGKKKLIGVEETDVELKLEETLRSIGGLDDVLSSFKKSKSEVKKRKEEKKEEKKEEEKVPSKKKSDKSVSVSRSEKLDDDLLKKLTETVGSEIEFSFLEDISTEEEGKKVEEEKKERGDVSAEKVEEIVSESKMDPELRDGIEEVDFFLRIGLYPEAQESIEHLREKFGNHPEIEKRLKEIEKIMPQASVEKSEPIVDNKIKENIAQSKVSVEEVTFEPVHEENVISEISPDEVNIDVFNTIGSANIEDEIDSSFELISKEKEVEQKEVVNEDVSSDTNELELINKKSTFIAMEEPASKLQEIHNIFSDIVKEAEKVFSDMEEGEEEVSSENGNFSTHYDLGIAYKEMSLIDDAVKEFQKAYNVVKDNIDSEDYRKVCHMLSMCFLDKGLFNSAIKWSEKGLKSKGGEKHEYMALKYDMAVAYEKMGEFKKALELFSEIYEEDVSFMDVATKIDYLKGKS